MLACRRAGTLSAGHARQNVPLDPAVAPSELAGCWPMIGVPEARLFPLAALGDPELAQGLTSGWKRQVHDRAEAPCPSENVDALQIAPRPAARRRPRHRHPRKRGSSTAFQPCDALRGEPAAGLPALLAAAGPGGRQGVRAGLARAGGDSSVYEPSEFVHGSRGWSSFERVPNLWKSIQDRTAGPKSCPAGLVRKVSMSMPSPPPPFPAAHRVRVRS